MIIRNKIVKVYQKIIPSLFRGFISDIYLDYVEWGYYKLKWLLLYGTSDFFEYFSIEPSTFCNFRCTICPNSEFDRGLKENNIKLPQKLIEKVIDQLSKKNYRGWFSPAFYNEPLSDTRTDEMLFYAKEKMPNCKIIINTNGTYLTEERYLKLKNIVSCFVVSQYDGTPLRKIQGLMKKYPDHKIMYRVMNKSELLTSRGGIIDVPKVARLYCQSPIMWSLIVTAEGKVISCCNDYHSEVVFGNVGSESILDIWKKKEFREFRKEVRSKIFKHDVCKRCIGEL